MTGPRSVPPAAALVLLAAAGLGTASLLYSEALLTSVLGPLTHKPHLAEDVTRARLYLGAGALVLAAAGAAAIRLNACRRLAMRPLGVKLSLLTAFVIAPLGLVEIALGPLVRPAVPKTTIYMRDDVLGWKHRPHAVGVWDRQEVRINGMGLRGPDVQHAKPPDRFRMLFLGDSVTFGDGLARDEQAFPHRVESRLTNCGTRRAEAINAGVSGYSIWQEGAYLRAEGLRYEPDVVVVTFVLNDLTEQFDLKRFGGLLDGWQLANTYSSRFERALSQSNIGLAAMKVSGRLRFGVDAAAGASAWERVKVRSLVDEPDSPAVQEAWRVTLGQLDDLVGLCRERNLPVVLVVAPYRFQLESPDADGPQRRLKEYATRQRVPVLDLLPVFARRVQDGESPGRLFSDSNHFTPRGHDIVADAVTRFLIDLRLC